jgi:hypothetical protein
MKRWARVCGIKEDDDLQEAGAKEEQVGGLLKQQ